MAQGYDVSQRIFTSSFQLIDWIRLDKLLQRYQIRRHTPNASLLYILAEHDMPNLIQMLLSSHSFLEVEDERYGAPLIAALATGSKRAVQIFLRACIAKQSPQGPIRKICNEYAKEERIQPGLRRSFNFSRHRDVLSNLAEIGDEAVFAAVLGTEKFAPNCKDMDGRTPLCYAVSFGHGAIVKMLLDTGKVDVSSQDNNGQTPLSRAIKTGSVAIAKLLLDTGEIDINSESCDGQSPLFWAIDQRSKAIVKLLLEKGKVEVHPGTPLPLAGKIGDEPIVKLLLDAGTIDANAKCMNGHTLLWWAIEYRNDTLVKLLLDTGQVEVNLQDLYHAVNATNKTIIKLLLDTGKIDVNPESCAGDPPPLWMALLTQNESLVKLLLDYSGMVDVYLKGLNGQAPLYWAIETGNETMVELLLNAGEVEVNQNIIREARSSLMARAESESMANLLDAYLDVYLLCGPDYEDQI